MTYTRQLCYYTGEFFLDQLQDALEHQDVEVIRCNMAEDEESFGVLEQYLNQKFDGVVDINSKLPYLILEDHSFFLDHIDAPFYNYIVDHPLYHHPGLIFPLKNYHAIGIDRTHCSYMEKHYKNLQSVLYHTIPGSRALVEKTLDERKTDILFSGTYESEEKQLQILRGMGENYERLGRALIEAYPYETMEGALQEILLSDARFEEFAAQNFAVLMNHLYPVDKYIRNVQRRSILEKMADCGLHFTIMGEGWEDTRLSNMENVAIVPPRTIALNVEAIAGSKAVIDVNPLFPCGIHDRVTTAMANHTLCVSNMSSKADEKLRDEKELFYYTNENVSVVCEKLQDFGLGCRTKEKIKEDAIAEMTEAAYLQYQQRYSWEVLARELF